MKINTFSKNWRILRVSRAHKTRFIMFEKFREIKKKKSKIILKFQVQDKSVVEGVDCLMMHELVLGGEK